MTSRSISEGNRQSTGSLHRVERGAPTQSRLTEFLLDVAAAVGAVLAALIGAVCLTLPIAYYLFF